MQLPGRGPTAPVAVDITGVIIVLTVSSQNVLSTAANSQVPPAEVSNARSSGTTNTASETSGAKLSSKKVDELPLNGRDFSTLLLLAAGTMTDVNGQTNFTQQFAINGQRGVEAVFAMDGADTVSYTHLDPQVVSNPGLLVGRNDRMRARPRTRPSAGRLDVRGFF